MLAPDVGEFVKPVLGGTRTVAEDPAMGQTSLVQIQASPTPQLQALCSLTSWPMWGVMLPTGGSCSRAALGQAPSPPQGISGMGQVSEIQGWTFGEMASPDPRGDFLEGQSCGCRGSKVVLPFLLP